ncbi:DNA/RNA helicase domain-containing protein [Sphingorhabdus buctiana]|uniref:DNA/RNA helicase domain-containing protein n=1 Tax=Sphingorhabdus buctiana TaxID=1508805 RepID=A0ABW4MAN8_9SPHN
MAGYYVSKADEFTSALPETIVNQLATRLIEHFQGDHERQLYAWREQVRILQAKLQKHIKTDPNAADWGIIIEYPLLRLQRRLDVIVLAGDIVTVIEFKVGDGGYNSIDKRQVEDYALGLRDFHESSHGLRIWPLLCVTEGPPGKLSAIDQGVGEVATSNAEGLNEVLSTLSNAAYQDGRKQIDVKIWNAGAYRPVPTIVQAAEDLFAGHDVTEIAAAAADRRNLGETTDALIYLIERARNRKQHLVIFVTGVPGSGKTLVGLNAVHDKRFSNAGQNPGAYLSGNTPLVKVLQEALALDARKREGIDAKEAKRRINASVQTLMNFLREYLNARPDNAPADHVVVFDEAQRAWDAAYGKQKFDRPKSEASLFLEIMGRHDDWAVIIALVGGGQEINKGELGLSEWGRALAVENDNPNTPHWFAVASPEVLDGGEATAWQTLFDGPPAAWAEREPSLHLNSSIRSYGSPSVPPWVNSLLAGNLREAARISQVEPDFPVYLTRSLNEAKEWLTRSARGNRRCGLVASSGARRIRADGLGVSLGAAQLDDLAHWFLRGREDIRSSYALEVTANEYGCQGLELDYVGVCWDGDLLWDAKLECWAPRRLNGAKWQSINQHAGRTWALNKYRVLLTRARLGSIIWVPQGSKTDPTRSCQHYDGIADALKRAGARTLSLKSVFDSR